MKNRREILGNLLQASTALNLALDCMTPVGDTAAFDALRNEVQRFIAWAASESDRLDTLGSD